MAKKVRHLLERDGRYYARLVVPTGLRRRVGKSELRTPLGADRRSALHALPRAVAGLQDVLVEARRSAISDGESPSKAPKRPLSLTAIAQLRYAEGLDFDAEIRNQGPLGSKGFLDETWVQNLKLAAAGAVNDDDMNALVGHHIRAIKERGYSSVASGTPEWRELARTLAAVELEILSRTVERDEGDYSGKPVLPALLEVLPQDALEEEVSLEVLFEAYIRELRRAGKGAAAEQRWRPVFKNLIKFLGHADAGQVTRSELLRWRDSLLETHAPRTVRDVYVASVKAVLQWAVDNGQISSNPANNVKTRVHRAQQGREKGFTDEEARAILGAAWNYNPPHMDNPQTREGAHMTQAKRWVPWLCAFTGARVAEITQLRKDDVRSDAETVFLRITPDAGSTKTGRFRDVPLHPQILDLGFLGFVAAAPSGPLFYSTAQKRRSAQHPSKFVAQRLSTWIRSLRIIGDDVAPSHGWRHRMKTIGRDLHIDAHVLDEIQGHAPRTAGEGYGHVTLKAKAAAIARFPRIEIAKASEKGASNY